MERKFYTDNFEQLLKEKSDEFRMYPSKRVWHSIYNDLHPGRKWPSVAVSMILIIALLMVGYWNNNSTKTTLGAISKQKNIVAAKNTSSPAAIADLHTTAFQPSFSFTPGNEGIALDLDKNTAANKNNLITTAEHDVISNTTTAQTSTVHNLTRSKQPNANNNVALQPTIDKIVNNIPVADQPQAVADKGKAITIQGGEFNHITIRSGYYASQQNGVAAIVSAAFNPTGTFAAEENPYTYATGTTTAASELNNAATTSDDNNIIASANNVKNNTETVTPNSGAANKNITAASKKEETNLKSTALFNTDKKPVSTEDKAWIEDYAFHNKSKRKKWQDRTSLEFYVTPSIGYRKLSNDPKYNPIPASAASPLTGTVATNSTTVNQAVNQTPGLGFETGLGITYSLAKNLRVKAGFQFNYTNYGVNAEATNHPVLTTLMLIDPNTSYTYIEPVSSTLANSNVHNVKVHNKTYQVSLPIGAALKLSGKNKLEWYAGATIQPTFLVGSKLYLVSSDRKNYVEDPTLTRRWNLNAGFETYINYKFDGFTLQVGPQFRYQLLSTFYNTYTVKENLYNAGLKIGILKNF